MGCSEVACVKGGVLVMSKGSLGRRKRGCVDEVCERAMLDGVGVMGWS